MSSFYEKFSNDIEFSSRNDGLSVYGNKKYKFPQGNKEIFQNEQINIIKYEIYQYCIYGY